LTDFAYLCDQQILAPGGEGWGRLSGALNWIISTKEW